MTYEMKDLLPMVITLAKGDTSMESNSICEEKAKQFMEAVLYTIALGESNETEYEVSNIEPAIVSAKQSYLAGGEKLKTKFAQLQMDYQICMEHVKYYGNECLKELMEKGYPAFFKYYDMTYFPQNTILTMDYPILNFEPKKSGILALEHTLESISKEQEFLSFFSEEFVIKALISYHESYELLIINIAEVVYEKLLLRIFEELAGEESIELMKEDDFYSLFDVANRSFFRQLQVQNEKENYVTKERFFAIRNYLEISYHDIRTRFFYSKKTNF